jgi:transcriptional regulator with XRE-family HTH domain
MDCRKVGELILSLRKEKNMTQKDVADMMNISDKTISKWERGLGCPDVSLLCDLSGIFGVNIEKILLGDLDPNDIDGGNMKSIKFFVCPNCGSIVSNTGKADISCCGRKLEPLIAKAEDDKHKARIDKIEEDCYITIQHEMSKSHYISFVLMLRVTECFL